MSVGVCIASSSSNSFNSTNNPLTTMPVASVSPRRFSTTSNSTSTSSALVGSYRSTVDLPYYSSRTGSYVNTRTTNTYLSSRNLDKTDPKRIFSRHSSISDDSGIASSRTSSFSRSSETRDLPPPRRDLTGLSITGRRISSLAVADSVDDLRQKYSPSNYTPNIRKPEPKGDYLSRSKSISNDIGRPPPSGSTLDTLSSRASITRNDSKLVNNSHNLTNNTNCGTNDSSNISSHVTDNVSDSDNNNLLSVSEIRKLFDTPTKLTSVNELKSDPTIAITSTGTTITITNTINKHAIIGQDCEPVDDLSGKCQNLKLNNGNNVRWAFLSANGHEDLSNQEVSKGNHTTNFASYIPVKTSVGDSNLNDLAEQNGGSENCDDTMSKRQSRITPPPPVERYTSNSGSSSPTKDLSTSPRLNRATTSISPNTSNGSPSTLERQRAPTLERYDAAPVRAPSYGGGPSQSVKHLGLNGLRNIGNTCFMNSVIQCLSNTRLLLEYLRDSSYVNDINTTTSSMKGALVKAFANVIQELWSGESDKIVNTTQFKSQIQRFAPRFMGFAQQDAQEFLRFFLEGLHEDVNRVTVKPAPILTEIDDSLSDSEKATEAWQRYLRMDDSRIVDICVGQLKSTLKCSVCGYCSVTFDPFWDLSLPLGSSSIIQCLENFTREETLDGHEKPTCSKCQTRRKCTKSFSIQKFPRILVLHLKRFSPNERFRGKLTTLVDFPLQSLDLSQFAANRGTSGVYNLYAVSNHSGTTYSGHYTAYCKHPYSGDWHEYNDSRVSSIAPRNVVSSEAYVLFYELSGHYSHL